MKTQNANSSFRPLSPTQLAEDFIAIVAATDNLKSVVKAEKADKREADFVRRRVQEVPKLNDIMELKPDLKFKIDGVSMLGWAAAYGWTDAAVIVAKAVCEDNYLSWKDKHDLFREAIEAAKVCGNKLTHGALLNYALEIGPDKTSRSLAAKKNLAPIQRLIQMFSNTDPAQQSGIQHLVESILLEKPDLSIRLGGLTALEWAANEDLGDCVCTLASHLLRDRDHPLKMPERRKLVKDTIDIAVANSSFRLAARLEKEFKIMFHDIKTHFLQASNTAATYNPFPHILGHLKKGEASASVPSTAPLANNPSPALG